MYCPKCSQQQASDHVRFCSRCGFQLNIVKELLATDCAPTNEAQTPDRHPGPRQKDVNFGSTLMLIGAALAALSTTVIGGPPSVVIGGALLVFTAVLVFILLFSQPLMRALYKLLSGGEEQNNLSSSRRSDANIGAMSMFIATLISMFIAMFLGADNRTPILLVSVISFVFTLLLSNRLVQTFHRLFSEGAGNANPVLQVSPATRNPPALPPAQSIPIANTSSQRVNTAEMVQPPSITEHTTTLLDKT